MAALHSSFLTDLERAGLAEEIAAAELDLARFRGLLKRPEINGAVRVKAGWSIAGLERWLRNARRMLA